MPVIQPLFTTILIRRRRQQLQPLQQPRRLPVILVTTVYSIRTTINDKRPFTPCEFDLNTIGDFSHERKKQAQTTYMRNCSSPQMQNARQ